LPGAQNGSPHTIRVYQRVGERFLGALAAAGSWRQWRTCRQPSRPSGARRTAQRFGRQQHVCGRREVVPGLCSPSAAL